MSCFFSFFWVFKKSLKERKGNGVRYWALAVPTLVVVAVALSMLIYMGSNFLATPPPTSFSTIADDYSRERTVTNPITQRQEEAETPIEPISDIGIHRINDVMFAPDPTLYI